MSGHHHEQASDNPSDGDIFACQCGYMAEFVVGDETQPGEWIQTSVT